MRIEPELSNVSVVLSGKFNPAIFTPAWFAMHGLLPERAAERASLAIAHQQVTEFSIDWLRLFVEPHRFLIETSQAPYIRLRDLVVRVFTEHLRHTPLKAFGINRHVHFLVSSFAARDRIGRALAPVEPWGDWGKDLGLDGEHGGMTSLTMSQVNPKKRPEGGRINVRVGPSSQIGNDRLGVYVAVNDHYEIDEANLGAGKRLMRLLENGFDESLARSDGIIDHIMSLAKSPGA